MCRFIETICSENGSYPLLEYHQKRLNKAFLAHFPYKKPHDLKQVLPTLPFKEKYKVRVVYGPEDVDVEYGLYVPRKLQKIKLVIDNEIDYAHKYEDRSELKELFDRREEADEILILKNGLVTDSFFANPVFWDGFRWYASSAYLLNGVRRQFLLDQGKVKEREINETDLFSFEKIGLVNALIDLGESVIPVRNIIT